MKAWFQCLQDASTADSKSAETSDNGPTLALVSSIATQVKHLLSCFYSRVDSIILQNRTCVIDTFDAVKITYLAFCHVLSHASVTLHKPDAGCHASTAGTFFLPKVFEKTSRFAIKDHARSPEFKPNAHTHLAAPHARSFCQRWKRVHVTLWSVSSSRCVCAMCPAWHPSG